MTITIDPIDSIRDEIFAQNAYFTARIDTCRHMCNLAVSISFVSIMLIGSCALMCFW